MVRELDYVKQYQGQLFNLMEATIKSSKSAQEKASAMTDELYDLKKYSSQY